MSGAGAGTWLPYRGAIGTPGLLLEPDFVGGAERAELLRGLETIQPIWEWRRAPRMVARGASQRRLLRPVSGASPPAW